MAPDGQGGGHVGVGGFEVGHAVAAPVARSGPRRQAVVGLEPAIGEEHLGPCSPFRRAPQA